MPKRPVPATILPTEPHPAAAPVAQAPAAPAAAHDEPPVEPAPAEPASDKAPPSAEEATTAHLDPAPLIYVPDEPPAINSLPAGTRLKEIDIPLKKYAGSYIPTSLTLTLTPSQARALVNFGEGLRALNVRVDHPADALKRFLERIAD